MEDKVKRLRVAANFDGSLSPGETLLLWRRRMGWNQLEAATHFKVSIFTLKLAEYDKARNFKYRKNIKIALRDYEKCLIHRKRSGLTQEEVAKQVGVGRYWLRLQEKGDVPCKKLLEFWEGKG